MPAGSPSVSASGRPLGPLITCSCIRSLPTYESLRDTFSILIQTALLKAAPALRASAEIQTLFPSCYRQQTSAAPARSLLERSDVPARCFPKLRAVEDSDPRNCE